MSRDKELWFSLWCWHQQVLAWRHHKVETFSALPVICAGNSPVHGEFLAQWPVARSIDVFFDLRRNKQLSKQWWGWWFETPSCPLWRHCNGTKNYRWWEAWFTIITLQIYRNFRETPIWCISNSIRKLHIPSGCVALSNISAKPIDLLNRSLFTC